MCVHTGQHWRQKATCAQAAWLQSPSLVPQTLVASSSATSLPSSQKELSETLLKSPPSPKCRSLRRLPFAMMVNLHFFRLVPCLAFQSSCPLPPRSLRVNCTGLVRVSRTRTCVRVCGGALCPSSPALCSIGWFLLLVGSLVPSLTQSGPCRPLSQGL